MPTEAGRVTKRKRINLPSGGAVDIPVITQISFIDPNERYQESQYSIDNSAQAERTIHVVTVHGDVDGNTSGGIQVERIDKWQVFDAADRGQETQISVDNVTGEDAVPYPHFSTHLRTHNVTYHSTQDDQAAVITELIDEFVVYDLPDRGQDTHFTLNNPPAGSYTLDQSDADVSDTANGVDPPYRTDPFQNIVAWRDTSEPPPPPWYGAIEAGAGLMQVEWNYHAEITSHPTGGTICNFQDSPAHSSLGNFGRPLSYGLCDWPIPAPLDPPPPQEVPWGLIAYSAGTLYKTRSEFEQAFDNRHRPTGSSFIVWAFNATGGGPDGGLGSGALAPELNGYFSDWENAREEARGDGVNSLYYPAYPVFRIFLVEDADWQTWMAGIHDLVDVPPLPTA